MKTLARKKTRDRQNKKIINKNFHIFQIKETFLVKSQCGSISVCAHCIQKVAVVHVFGLHNVAGSE